MIQAITNGTLTPFSFASLSVSMLSVAEFAPQPLPDEPSTRGSVEAQPLERHERGPVEWSTNLSLRYDARGDVTSPGADPALLGVRDEGGSGLEPQQWSTVSSLQERDRSQAGAAAKVESFAQTAELPELVFMVSYRC